MPNIEDAALDAVKKADTAGGLTSKEMAAASVAKTERRITLDDVKGKVSHTEFYRPEYAQHVTIAVLTLINGAVVTGMSAPADPNNYDPQLGEKISVERAMDQIWAFEGYMLRQQMFDEDQASCADVVETAEPVDLLADEEPQPNDDEGPGDSPDDLVQA